MADLVASVDWSGTPLGPAGAWPQSLRTALSICLSSRFPMLVWWGPELTVFYNDAYLPLLGNKHPSALGARAADTWAEAWAALGPLARSVMAGHGATFSEDQLLFLQRHGYLEESYWTFSYSPIRDESGGVGGVFIAVTDTTKRVVDERRLRVLRDLGELSATTTGTAGEAVRAAVEVLDRHRASVPLALAYVRDAEGVFRLAGSSGIRPGCPLVPATLPPDSPWPGAATDTGGMVDGLRERWADWFEPGPLGDAVPEQALVFALTPAGEEEPVGLIVLGVNPYRELDHAYRSFFDLAAGHVTTAVSDALAYQAERRRAEALAELDRAKTDFFSNVSHEFRTPLTLITGPLAELRAAPEIEHSPLLREELDVIARNADRLGKLVNTLLDFSRVQSGRIEARFEPVDLAAFTGELASVFRSAVARAGLEFAVDCPPLPQPVHVDREMWEKVVLNLLSNAVKYTFDGGITVRLRPEDDAAVLTVTDTGTGIPAEELPRLFERFHRVPHARARSGEGSGIGLAMVRELVVLHGGTITADSAPGRGTAFTVRLPWGSGHLPADQLARSDEPAALPASPAVSSAARSFVGEALRWMPGQESTDGPGPLPVPAPPETAGRVLVADDNADMREYLQRLLTPRYSVQVAGDGAAALAAALADPPDLVVSDVMMPELDGMQLLAALRADSRTARVPVVLLSARAGQEAAVEGLAAGADDYLVKPFTAEELLARVDAHLRLGRVRRDAEARFRAMADLAPALIWVAAPDGERIFLNEGWRRFTGRPAAEDLGQGWRESIHPDDREGYLAAVQAARAAGTGWEVEFRLRRSDGAYHWLLERAAPIGAGQGPAGFVGSCTDINARYRETERQTVLAELGTALDAEVSVEGQLTRLARVIVERRMADFASVRRLQDDGTLVRVGVAATDPETEEALGRLHSDTGPAVTVLRSGRALLLPELSPDWWDHDPRLPPEEARIQEVLQLRSVLAVPLTVRGRMLAVLALGRRGESPRFNDDDRVLQEEIAARAALSLDNALLLAEERAAAVRLALLQRVTADLSAASTPVEVAEATVGHLHQVLGDVGQVGFFEADAQQRSLRRLAVLGEADPDEDDERWAEVALTTPLPITVAVGENRPLWPEELGEVAGEQQPPWLDDVREQLRIRSSAALPLTAFGRVVGVIGLGLSSRRPLTDADRAMLLAVAEQSAQALDRARLYRAEQRVAETLQRSLLPQRLPGLGQLSLAARYLPGAEGTQAGGDWYDVVDLGESRVAIAVGDVVGQGPAAAAVMGQLRSALSTALLQGHAPAAALEVLDRFAARLPGATASSAACLVVDWAEGEVCWARAGHLPPLLVEAGTEGSRVRVLDDAGSGTVLGIPGRPPFTQGRTAITPGCSLLLYTDGLVERRSQPVDEGIARLERILRELGHLAPEPLAAEIVRRALPDDGQPDDVALIIARVLPAPFTERLPALPRELSGLRRRVHAWATALGVPLEVTDDLQLALGEAVSNSMEHAYRNAGGGDAGSLVEVTLTPEPDGGVQAVVRDFGHWREAPADRGFRGRGLEMIRALSTHVVVESAGDLHGGTRLSFRFPSGPGGRPAADLTAPVPQPRPRPLVEDETGFSVRAADDGVWLELPGELDLQNVSSLRPTLLAELAGARHHPAASVTVDLRRTSYLASAGVGLLLEAAAAARSDGTRFLVLAEPAGVPARVLALAGLDSLLRPPAVSPAE